MQAAESIFDFRTNLHNALNATVSEILVLRSRVPVIWKHLPRGLGQRYVGTRAALLLRPRDLEVDRDIIIRAMLILKRWTDGRKELQPV